MPIYSEQTGVVEFHDIIDDVTVKKEADESTGLSRTVVMEHKEDLHPQILILNMEAGEVLGYYSIPAGAHIVVKQGQQVTSGSQLAKTPRRISKVKDITGGLPRVSENLTSIPRSAVKRLSRSLSSQKSTSARFFSMQKFYSRDRTTASYNNKSCALCAIPECGRTSGRGSETEIGITLVPASARLCAGTRAHKV